jgi:carbamoyl-phosphate synthase large subunit
LDWANDGFVEDVLQTPFWLRARWGAGAKAAILARTYIEAESWLEFWSERDPSLEFVAEGFLPGRDLAWSSIWYEGELVCSFTRERLEYIYPGLTPEGLTGTPTRARIVHDDAVNLLGPETVYAVDEKPHGIFSVDFREDEDGVPRPTEINAGRGFTTFGLWAKECPVNLLDIIVMAATTGLPHGGMGFTHMLAEGLELVRHIDCGTFMYTPLCA